MHFAGTQFSYLLNGSNPHKCGQGCGGEEERGGPVQRLCSPVQPKCLLGDTLSCQHSVSSVLSLFPLTRRKKVANNSRRPVSWGSEQWVRAGYLGYGATCWLPHKHSVDAYCVPELEGAVVLLGGRGQPQHLNEQLLFTECLLCVRMMLELYLDHLIESSYSHLTHGRTEPQALCH